MNDSLGRFLRDQAALRFGFGIVDCQMMPADWAVILGYPDPAAHWRGVYHDEAGADAIVRAHGGLVGLMTAGMALSGLSVSNDAHAVRGDLGAVRVLGKDGPVEVGAVCTGQGSLGSRWATRARRGLWIGPAEPLAIWRLEWTSD